MKTSLFLLFAALLCGCATDREHSRRNSAFFNAWLDAQREWRWSTTNEHGVIIHYYAEPDGFKCEGHTPK